MTEKEIERFRYETSARILAAYISAKDMYNGMEEISVNMADRLIEVLKKKKNDS